MTQRFFRQVCSVATVLTVLAIAGSTARLQAASPDSAPALPAPTGRVVNVSSVGQLLSAISGLRSGDTVMIAAGTYQLTSPLWVNGAFNNVTIRGASNNRNDVVLVGRGMSGSNDGGVPFGIWTGNGVTNITIANLTIRDVYNHPINLNAGTESPRIYNVRLVNAGQQFIKSNPDGSGGGVDNGSLEYSVLEYESASRDAYTNGLDVHGGRGWVVRHNLFRRIRAPQGQLAGPAVLLWNDSRDSIVEGNTFIDNHRDISLGLIERTPNDHTGGIIRNNMIVRTAGAGGDVPIAVYDSPGTKVVHNTILLNGAYPNSIESRFGNASGISLVNNLSDRGVQARDGASWSQQGNVYTAAAGWFVNPGAGDLHLQASASGAIDRGAASVDAQIDWDGQPRPQGAGLDVGADEVGGSTPPPAEVCGDGIDNDGDGQVDEGCAVTPQPVACTVSSWSGWEATTAWSACNNGSQTRTERRTRTVVTPAANGGAACPALEETRTATQACTTTPAPVACTVSSWSSWQATSEWSACNNGTQSRTESRTRTVVTQPANGGAACPALQESRTASQACTPPAVEEICGDGIDNDRDGRVDEDCPTAQVPGRPGRFRATVSRSTVSLSWLAPISGGAVKSYRVEAGLAPGQTAYTVPVGLNTTATVPNVGRGQYFLRVVAVNDAGAGRASREVAVTVGCGRAPRRPTSFSTQTSGNAVAFTWTDPDGCSNSSYRIAVGSTPGASDLGEIASDAPDLSVVAPSGTYYARVITVAESGVSEPSDEVQVTVGAGVCTGPSFQTALAAQVDGPNVTLTWNPVVAAAAVASDAVSPLSYVVEVGSTPGAADLMQAPVGRTTSITTPALPGTYYVRVRPVDACGAGTASNETVVRVQ